MFFKKLFYYIAKTVLLAILCVAGVVLLLQMFILFAHELNDIGHGQYHLAQAFYFVLFQSPTFLYQFFPLVALVGTVLGLGVLASSNELTVMRASGLSIAQILIALSIAALCMTILVFILGEGFAPAWIAKAKLYKAKAIHDTNVEEEALAKNVWLYVDNKVIYINRVLKGKQLEDIRGYELSPDFELKTFWKAVSGEIDSKGWHLNKVELTHITTNKIIKDYHETELLPINIPASKLVGLGKAPEQLSL